MNKNIENLKKLFLKNQIKQYTLKFVLKEENKIIEDKIIIKIINKRKNGLIQFESLIKEIKSTLSEIEKKTESKKINPYSNLSHTDTFESKLNLIRITLNDGKCYGVDKNEFEKYNNFKELNLEGLENESLEELRNYKLENHNLENHNLGNQTQINKQNNNKRLDIEKKDLEKLMFWKKKSKDKAR